MTLSDIPADISIPVPEDIEASAVPVARFAERTNGLVYAQLAIDELEHIPDSESKTMLVNVARLSVHRNH